MTEPQQAELPLAPPAKTYPRCEACSKEMTPELDAYYGFDPRGKTHCDPCRRKMKIP